MPRPARREEEPSILPLHYTHGQHPLPEGPRFRFRQDEVGNTAHMNDATEYANARAPDTGGGIDQLQSLRNSFANLQNGLSYVLVKAEEISQQLDVLLPSFRGMVIEDDTSPPNIHPQAPVPTSTVISASANNRSLPGAFESSYRPITPPTQRQPRLGYPRPTGSFDRRGPRQLEISPETETTTLSSIVVRTDPRLPVDDRSSDAGTGLGTSASNLAGGREGEAFGLRNFTRLSPDSRSIASSPPRAGLSSNRGRRVFASPVLQLDVFTVSSPEAAGSSSNITAERQLAITGRFTNGKKLASYQLKDLQRILKRELGEEPPSTDATNNKGFMLAYNQGMEKMPLVIALIACNPPSSSSGRVKNTLIVVKNQHIQSQWEEQFEKYAPNFRVTFCKSGTLSELSTSSHVTFITYTIFHKFKDNVSQFLWHRIVLDPSGYYTNPTAPIVEVLCDAVHKRHGLCLIEGNLQNKYYYCIFRFLGVTYLGINDYETFKRIILARSYRGRAEGDRVIQLLKKDFCIFPPNAHGEPEE